MNAIEVIARAGRYPSPKERLLTAIVITPSGCWEWTHTRNSDGYGKLHVNGREQRAHRVSYKLFVGPIPPKMLICHHCDNPPCINPEHLYAGTHSDNAKDTFRRGRPTRARGEDHPEAKLKEGDVRAIYSHRHPPRNVHSLATKFNVSKSTVHRIWKGDKWKHLIAIIEAEESMIEEAGK